jgi:hypothetical protein
MNCQEFESSITDVVRNESGDDTLCARVLAHAESCTRCAARLEEEQALTRILKAAAADKAEAPAHLEAALLSAYRMRPAIPPGKAVPRPIHRALPARYLGIAAALLVALIGVTAYKLLYVPRSIGTPVARTAGSETVVQTSSQPGKQTAAAAANSGADSATASPRAAIGKSETKNAAAQRSQAQADVATDFIALSSDAELASMESGQLVRVMLPRSALAAWGLPFNREIADKPVSAQVLIGQDGIARAIRFLGDPEVRIVPAVLPSK